MILLQPADYFRVKPSLRKVEINHLFVRAVIESKMNGFVYVDNLDQPTSFYLKHDYGMSLLFGKTDNEKFNQKLKTYLLNEDGKRESVEWLQVFPEAWNFKIKELLDDRLMQNPGSTYELQAVGRPPVLQFTRVNFRFKPEKYVPIKIENQPGLELCRTRNGFFNKIGGTVVPSKFWRNEPEFLQQGIGFSLIKDGAPVSTAFSAFVHKPLLELGIETLPEFFGKGYAQATCSALIDYCLEHGYEPVWSCKLENASSFKLAQKLGFEVERTVPYYQLPI